MVQLKEVFLKKIEFNCIREIVLNNHNLSMKTDININSKYNRKEKILSVTLEVSGHGTTENNVIPLEFLVTIEGIFKINLENELNNEAMDLISKIKAPQLLFPFVLENIQNLTLRAGIKPLVLPLIDFEKLYSKKNNFNESKIIN
jgi:preprotein translocase subunit SecB